MKSDARAMKGEAVRRINELGRNPNNVFKLVRKMRISSTDVAGGRCMRENDGKLTYMRRIEQNSGKHIFQWYE